MPVLRKKPGEGRALALAENSRCRVYVLRTKAPLARGFYCRSECVLDRDRSELRGVDIDEAAVLALVLEADNAVDFGEECVVLAAADIGAGLERGSALADDDASTKDGLAAEDFDAEPLGV
jgi:hypothetical protein